MDTKIVKK